MQKKLKTGYCSFCFEKTNHQLIEENSFRRDEYICTNCSRKTFLCRFCNNFTKGGSRWDDELCAEHGGEISSFTMLNHKLNSLEEYEVLFKRESVNIGKVSRITTATVGGVALLTPLALVAAPAIGGAIGVGMGLSGVVAVDAGLTAIGGTAILGATGAALGGTLGGVISNNYFGDIDGFEIKKIKSGEGEIVLCIDGFLTEDNDDTKEWERQLKELYPNNPWYYVSWESKKLHDLGKQILGHGGKKAIQSALGALAKKATKEGVKKMGPLGIALTALGVVNNPWSIACTKAGQTGIVLADILARTDKKYILCGHSLGARVIFYTLESLATKKKKNIQQVHLMGGAIGSNKKDWTQAKSAVIDKIYNYRSDNDYVLATMYKIGTFFASSPIGRNKIEVRGIVDVNVTSFVSGHTKYKENFSLFAEGIATKKGFFEKIFSF